MTAGGRRWRRQSSSGQATSGWRARRLAAGRTWAPTLRMLALCLLACGILAALCLQPALAQPASKTPAAQGADAAVAVPGFWDPRRRPERPDLTRVTQIRFMTEIDYPPFNY